MALSFYSKLWTYLSSRHFLARLTSTLLCSILVIFSGKYGGNIAFLALTIKELHFAPQHNFAQQSETLILNLFGGITGIGLSLFGNYLATLTDNAALSRTIPAIFLASICFSMGWLKSALPRLTLSTRLVFFICIWMLTEDPGSKSGSLLLFAQYFAWLVFIAAITSLCPCLIFLHWSTAHLAQDVASAFSSLHECLQANLGSPFDTGFTPATSLHPTLDGLLKKAVALNSTYQQASFELRVGRIGVKSLKPFIATVEHLRREISWGMTFPNSMHRTTPDAFESSILDSLHHPATDLGCVILESISLIQSVVLNCYDVSHAPLKLDTSTIVHSQDSLIASVHRARAELERFCDDLDKEQRMSAGESSDLPPRAFNLCLYMISLLQMADELIRALNVAHNILHSYQTSSVRLWYPRFSLAWFGVAPSAIVLEENESFAESSYSSPDTTVDPSYRPTQEVFLEISSRKHQNKDNGSMKKSRAFACTLQLLRLHDTVRSIWNHPTTIQARLSLHNLVVAFRKSSRNDFKHAFKNALGVSVLAIPAFLPASSTGARQWFTSFHGQWMLISYIWVLQTNTGATMRVGYLRIAGTVLGAIYGYIASIISQNNPYALVAFMTLAEVPISVIIMHTSYPSLGVVANITLPPILFSSYMSGTATSAIELATVRGIMICAGIVAAVLVNGFVFPRHARVIFLDGICKTLGSLTELYIGLGRDLLHPFGGSGSSKRKALILELEIRNTLQRMSNLIVTMGDELSLVPIPMRKYRELVRTLQKLLDLFTGLRQIRENIPRKETVMEVVEQRRELVSCITLTLFACESVFGARHHLPQFLPSSRLALDNLKRSIDLHIRKTREKFNGPLGLSVIYALAEHHVLKDIVEKNDELLDITRQLFGTAAWFNVHLDVPPKMGHEQVDMF